MRICSRKSKIVAVLALIMGGVGMSACHQKSPEARVDYISEKISDKLDLTESQNGILNRIKGEIKADIASDKAYKSAVRDEIKNMVLSPELNQTRLKELAQERQQKMNAKIDKYLAEVAELHKTLSKEQKEKVVEALEKFTQHWD